MLRFPFTLSSDDDEDYIARMIVAALIIIPITRHYWPMLIPLTWGDVWMSSGKEPFEYIAMAWPLYLAGIVLNLVLSWNSIKAIPRTLRPDAGEFFLFGLFRSVFAGVMEEIGFRWLLFFSAMPFLVLSNFIFGGFFFDGWGLPRLLHYYIFAPVADFTTAGYLTDRLYTGSWYLGAAVITAASQFRDGHKHQGFFGWAWSWFAGMYFFWIMFNHGLLAAILIHTVYDIIIFTLAAIRIALQEQRKVRARRRWDDLD